MTPPIRILPVAVALALALLLLCTPIGAVTRVKSSSSYGSSATTFSGSSGSFSGGSYTDEIVCPSNLTYCTMSYEYTLSNLVVPTGDPVLTIDFASAISTDELDVLYTNSMFPSNIPGGTLDSTTLNNISSILSDSASGQEFKFDLSSLTLSQLNDLQIAVFILTDTVNSSPDTNPNDIPTFSASFGPSSVATPEPSSAALIVIALAGLAFLLVRRSAA